MTRAIVVALALAVAVPAAAEPQPEPLNAITTALPALDGRDGFQLSYDRWLGCDHLAWSASAGFRRSATGDYRGTRLDAGGELRWYHRPRMTGWWLGGRLDVDGDWTYDMPDARSLGTELVVSITARAGYRFAPWRGLVITPAAGLGLRDERDLSGRLPSVVHASLDVGLDLGWAF